MEWRRTGWTRLTRCTFSHLHNGDIICSCCFLPDALCFLCCPAVTTCSRRKIFISVSLPFIQVAMGHDYVAQVEQHSSQKDAAKGFGGKFGVQKDRVDKVRSRVESYIKAMYKSSFEDMHVIFVSLQSAMGFEYKAEAQQHASQKGRSHYRHFPDKFLSSI